MVCDGVAAVDRPAMSPLPVIHRRPLRRHYHAGYLSAAAAFQLLVYAAVVVLPFLAAYRAGGELTHHSHTTRTPPHHTRLC
jgi:hypothetical protein